MNRFLVTALVLVGLLGCGSPGDQGAMRADAVEPRTPSEGGIGGTGIELAEGRGGIGGTGASGAGVVGTVTGFGSIHLNGLRVVFPASGAVPAPRGMVAEADVDLGETLEIIGTQAGDGTITPTRAMFRFPVVGRVDGVAGDGTLSILGTEVTVEPGSLTVDGADRPVSIATGDWVQISGLPRGNGVVASRIERLPGPVRSGVTGRVERISDPSRAGRNVVRINGVMVDFGTATPPRDGWTVRVRGIYRNGHLTPFETTRGLLDSAAVPIPQVSVEGYLQPAADSNAPAIHGFGGRLDPGSRVASLAGQRALFIGTLAGETFAVRHGLILPDDGQARRSLLESVEDGFAPAGAIETR